MENEVQNSAVQNEQIKTGPVIQGSGSVTPDKSVVFKKRRFHIPKFLILLIALFLLLALMEGGYFLYKNSQNQSTSPAPTPIAKATPTPDPTYGLTSYQSKIAGYSFKYPSDWTVAKIISDTEKDEEKELQSSDYTEKSMEGPVNPISGGASLYIDNGVNPNFKDYNSYKYFILNTSTGHDTQKNIENNKEIVVSGEKCLFSENMKAFGGYVSACSMYHNGKTVDLTFHSISTDNQIFKQILSTFKFTDSVSPTTSQKKAADVQTKCKIAGCSNQLCIDASSKNIFSTCEYKESYACYKNADCEKQTNGKCGWTQTKELTTCINNSKELLE
jgi:hypothetical protein